jgi:predicted dehydrogenase
MNTKETLRLGILGCGAIGQIGHVPGALRARNITLTALCDGAPDLLSNVADRARVDKRYSDYSEFLADDEIQAVVIAVPDALHVPRAMDALRAGKHVLVEKPMGLNSDECADLVRCGEETGCRVQVGCMKRHDPGTARARKFLQESGGKILSVSAVVRDSRFRPAMQESCFDPIQTSGEAIRPKQDPKADRELYNLTTQSPHPLDMLRFLGGPISAVTCTVAAHNGNWSWHGLLEFDGGARGHLEITSKVCGDWREEYRAYGEHGSVEIDYDLWFYHRPARVRIFRGQEQEWAQPFNAISNLFANELDAFAISIINDEPCSPDGYEGLATVQVIEAIQESLRSGVRVECPASEEA